ncbi:large subunit ribosomal protein L6e [Clonorchis sinensis]|uniref:Large ribosomal subunit protein eL6 n=1 Tax=Clonorchis sinensis TaxID=79923 RepID=H2KV86_CLOSI|nr:large subunit ribosomal protein L6e [Clonorchis sinensis]
MEPSVVPALPSQLDTGMLLDRPSEISSSTKAEVEFPGNVALEFRQPISSGLQVHTTFDEKPVDIPICSEQGESADTTTFTKSSKRKRSTSKSKEKRKQKARGARSEPESDKNNTEEISTAEAPPTTEFRSEMDNTDFSTLESAELCSSYQLPVFQIPDKPTIPDMTAEHNGVPAEKDETGHEIRDIFVEEQFEGEQSKVSSEEKRDYEKEVPPTASGNGKIIYEESLMFESARSADLGSENMDIADVAMISSEVAECDYSIDQSFASLGANEILLNVEESNGVEKAKHAMDLKQTKSKAKRRGKHKADGSRSASESENLQGDKISPVTASTTATSMEFELMRTDHITPVQVESEKSEVSKPKSPTGLTSDVHYISSDIPPEGKEASETEETISERPKVHKSKRSKAKSKGKEKIKDEGLLSAPESENSSHEEVLTTLPMTEDVEKQKKTELFVSAGDVPLTYHSLTDSTLGDVSLDRESPSHPKELEFLEVTGAEQEIPKKKHRKVTKSKGESDQKEEVLRTTPDSERVSPEEVMDLPAVETGRKTTGLLEFAEPITFPNESLTSDHKAKRKRKGKNKGDILLSAPETEKSGPEDVSAITSPFVPSQRLADVEAEQKTTASLELAVTQSPTDLTLNAQTSRDDIVPEGTFPSPELGDTNEWKYLKTKGKGKPKHAKAHTSLESEIEEVREIPASPILMDLRPDDGGSHATVQFEVIEQSGTIHHPPMQPTPTEHTEDFFKVKVSGSLKATSMEQKHPTRKPAGLKGERKEDHTENVPRTVHESEPSTSKGPSSVGAPLMKEMELGLVDVPQEQKKPRGRKRSKSVPKQHSQQEESCLSQDSESLMEPRMEVEVVQTELSGKSEKTKVQERESRNGSAITSKNKKDKTKIIQPPVNVKTDTSSQISAGLAVSETQQGASMTESYPGEKLPKGGTKRKRKTDQSSHIETDSKSKSPKTKSSRAHEDSGASQLQQSAVTSRASRLEDATKEQLEESVCYSCRPVSPLQVNPDALFSRIPFWMRIRKKQSVIRRRRLMRKIDMKRKRAARREQLTDDAVPQVVTHRFPRSFETQPHPEKGKSQVRKRRRAVERLVKYRADQINRVQRPKTKKKPKRRLTALDRWKVRSSLRKRGVIVILLGGRHRGKRVVSLGRQKSTGLLLVTGPFRYNGCPLRRVHPNMVLATQTRVDLGKFKVPLRVHSKEYFARKKLDNKHDLDAQLGLSGAPDSAESKRFVPSEERKEDQRIIDEEVCKCIKAHADSRMLIKYLRSLFSLSKHDKPHAILFRLGTIMSKTPFTL